jgi:two-component sensor histidine kinase/tetratricopeptide (TPR) repeat protein
MFAIAMPCILNNWILLLTCLTGLQAAASSPDSLYLRIFNYQQVNQPDVYRFVDSLKRSSNLTENPLLYPYFQLWKGEAYLHAFDRTDSAFVYAYSADSSFQLTDHRSGQLQSQWLFALLHIKDRHFDQAKQHIRNAFRLSQSKLDSARCQNLRTTWMMHKNDTVDRIQQARVALNCFNDLSNRSPYVQHHHAMAYRNLAWCYQAKEDPALDRIALQYWHQALQTGGFSATYNAPAYLYILQNMVYCHRFVTQLDSASHYMKLAEDVLQNGRFPNIHWERMNFYRQYAWLEYERGNFKKAMDYLGESRAETDAYYNSKLESTATAIANDYEKKLREKEIKILTEKNQAKNKGLLIQTISLILLSILSVVTFYQFRKTKKQNHKIALQRDQLASLSKNLELSLSEVHHRIKNNLQIVTSLLNVQKNKLTSVEAKTALQESQSRIKAIALVHEQLYSFSEFDELNIKHYAEKVINSISRSSGFGQGIKMKVELDEVHFPLDKSVSVGIILNELTTNSFKYAFPDHSGGEVQVTGTKTADFYTLTVRDSGVGLPDGFNHEHSDGVGFRIIQALVAKLKADFSIGSNQGSCATIRIPLN